MTYHLIELENNEYDEKAYAAGEIDGKCPHRFKRVSPTRVECVKCHMGLFDNPSFPLPIDALNEYYENGKTKEYNEWL